MTAPKRPRQPAGLGAAGKRVWSAVLDRFEMEAHELELVESACRCRDMIARLEADLAESLYVTGSMGQQRLSPAVAELRQHRAAFSRLMADLALPVDEDGAALPSPASARAAKAAKRRWDQTRLREARNGA